MIDNKSKDHKLHRHLAIAIVSVGVFFDLLYLLNNLIITTGNNLSLYIFIRGSRLSPTPTAGLWLIIILMLANP